MLLFAVVASAQLPEAPQLLPPGEAFRLQATRSAPARVQLSWAIAPGYYLYRDRFRFQLTDGTRLRPLSFPRGRLKDDPYFGPSEIFRHQVVVEVALDTNTRSEESAQLMIVSQGCADIGVCFPPQTAHLALATGARVEARPDTLAALGTVSSPATAANPLAALSTDDGQLPVIRVRDNASLEAMLIDARRRGAPAMLNFYADWCIPCREMEARTFPAPVVRNALAQTLLLRADVSANSPDDVALLSRFGLNQPPAILFFDRAGEEQASQRVVGFMEPAPFAKRVREVNR